MSEEIPTNTDNEPSSPHHTLGEGPNQAASGNHKHDDRYLKYKRVKLTAAHSVNTFPNVTYYPMGWVVDPQPAGYIAWIYNPGPGSFVVPENGWYNINAWVLWAVQAAGGSIRYIEININGTTTKCTELVNPANAGWGMTSEINHSLNLYKGDVIIFKVYQSSGGPLATVGGSRAYAGLVMQKLDELYA